MNNGMFRGGAKKKSLKGGCGSNLLPLSPFSLTEGGDTLGTSSLGDMNYAQSPLTVPSSRMVGGGYGFTNNAAGLADVPSFAGSYFPVEKVCTAGMPDNNARGGNNFLQSGTMSGGGRGRRGKRRGMKKWRQRGCSTKNCKGGKKTKGKRTRKHKYRTTRRKMRGGQTITMMG